MKLIGKTILDSIGWTEKLGGITQPKIEPLVKMNDLDFWLFKKDLETLEKDPVQVDLYLKAHGLDKVEDLKDYILNNDIKQDNVNNLIQTQNYKNIADQAHGFIGVKKAISEYNKLTDAASKNKLAETINSTNSSLGKYLTGLDGATAGMGEYISSLATATVKTFTLKAVTMAFNMGTSLAISAVITKAVSAISNYVNAAKIARENTEALSSSLAESQNKYAEDSKKIGELSSRYETLSKDVNHLGQNVSLSSSQYDEYKSIIKQLSEIMPDLTLRFNEQSEAILD